MKLLIVALMILTVALPASAQTCREGRPCEGVPWQMPVLPPLRTPTPLPTLAITVSPTPSATIAPTNTPTVVPPAPTLVINATTIIDRLSTLEALASRTPEGITAYATPSASELGANSAVFFGYFRGLTETNFGVFTQFFNFIVFGFLFIVTLKIGLMLAPLLAAILGFFKRAISFLLEFVPGL